MGSGSKPGNKEGDPDGGDKSLTNIYRNGKKKAMMYEERINNSPCEVLRECLKEVRSGLRTWWTEKRRIYCNRNGWSDLEINAAGNRGESAWEILMKRDIKC